MEQCPRENHAAIVGIDAEWFMEADVTVLLREPKLMMMTWKSSDSRNKMSQRDKESQKYGWNKRLNRSIFVDETNYKREPSQKMWHFSWAFLFQWNLYIALNIMVWVWHENQITINCMFSLWSCLGATEAGCQAVPQVSKCPLWSWLGNPYHNV